MKILSSLFLLMFQLLTLFGQSQLHIEGSSSLEPVARIEVLNSDNPVTGLLINVPDGSHKGLDIRVSGVSTGINVETTIGIGGIFKSTGSWALEGSTHSPSVFGYGVYGTNTRNGMGTGVFGKASGTAGNNYGVRGQSNSSTGTGVYGLTTSNDAGIKYGVHGRSHHSEGIAVYGENNIGLSVYGFSDGTGVGVRGKSLRGFGGDFYSTFDSGLYAKGATGIPDIVLGIDREVEGEDDGIISADLSQKTSDVVMLANDKIILELDNDDDEDSFFQILNGKNEKILTLDENGNLDIMGTVSPTSDVNRKHDIIETDNQKILNKLAELKIYHWKYKSDNKPHIGPMAQDFHQSFELNNSDTSIASVDADGIALASIKALQELIYAQQREIEELKLIVEKALVK